MENHRDGILNVTSKDGKSPALSPTEELLDFMTCTMLVEAEAKVRSMLKAHSVRVKLPSILIKVLHTGDWCNRDADSSRKLSFFMNPSSEFDDEKN